MFCCECGTIISTHDLSHVMMFVCNDEKLARTPSLLLDHYSTEDLQPSPLCILFILRSIFCNQSLRGTMLCLTVSSYVFCSLSVELEGVVDKILSGGVMELSKGKHFQ